MAAPLPKINAVGVDTPVLVIGAEHDSSLKHSEIHATAAAYRTSAEIVPRAGHASMLDADWSTVANLIVTWLSAV
jgi:pimeloyl-ACP methyl ester carboxylesterase